MKTITFVLQVVGVALILVGIGQLLGVMIVLEILEKTGRFDVDISFWQSWSMLAFGALAVILGFGAEFIYDAGCNSAAKEESE